MCPKLLLNNLQTFFYTTIDRNAIRFNIRLQYFKRDRLNFIPKHFRKNRLLFHTPIFMHENPFESDLYIFFNGASSHKSTRSV